MPRTAFTMVEMVMVTALLALVAGMAVAAYGGVGAATDKDIIGAECARIRDACLRFHADVGRPPRLVAELLQDPRDPAHPEDPGRTSWWWRTQWNDGIVTLWDAASRRGWRGPYIVPECGYADDPLTTDRDESRTEERRLLYEAASSTYILRTLASDPPGRLLAMILDGCDSRPQQLGTGGRLRSHYQLEEIRSGGGSMLYVRFVADPGATVAAGYDPLTDGNVVARVPTGLQP
jgi:hypothetical protein